MGILKYAERYWKHVMRMNFIWMRYLRADIVVVDGDGGLIYNAFLEPI